MKLNTQGLNELRKKIEERLQSVPDGQRVHIDKELLDDLIFFKGKNKEGMLIKVPVWTGNFLRKIDLSEISFENVVFAIKFGEEAFTYCLEDIMDAEDVSRFIKTGDDELPEYQIPLANNNGVIDFSYTNANIDFSKMYFPPNADPKGAEFCLGWVHDCNFEGLDLSKANGEYIGEIERSNFSNTNIRLDLNNRRFNCGWSNFANNDFSDQTVDVKKIVFDDLIYRSDFSNTGLNINYVASDEYLGSDEKEYFGEEIISGYFDGCYINGKRVRPLAEIEANFQEKKTEYEKMKEDLTSAAMTSIEQEISGFDRK